MICLSAQMRQDLPYQIKIEESAGILMPWFFSMLSTITIQQRNHIVRESCQRQIDASLVFLIFHRASFVEHDSDHLLLSNGKLGFFPPGRIDS